MTDEAPCYKVVSLGPTAPNCRTCGRENPARFSIQHPDPCAPKPVNHLTNKGIFGKDDAEELAELLNEVLWYEMSWTEVMQERADLKARIAELEAQHTEAERLKSMYLSDLGDALRGSSIAEAEREELREMLRAHAPAALDLLITQGKVRG